MNSVPELERELMEEVSISSSQTPIHTIAERKTTEDRARLTP